MRTSQKIRRVHVSWHIAAVCGGLLIGVALSALIDISFATSPLWLLCAIPFLVIGIRRTSTAASFAFIAVGLIAGTWRGAGEQLALGRYEPYVGQVVEVQGRVTEDTSHGEGNEVRLQINNISVDGAPLSGKIWVSVLTDQTIKRSDTVRVRGELREGFGNLAASMSDAQLLQLQQTSRQDKALQARDWFADGIRQGIPEPQASLGSGFLTGQHSNLPGELEDQLKVVGLTHAVVASGSNLTILVGFTRRLFTRVSKYTATMAGGTMTAAFVMIAGMSPSMTRAGLVTGLSLAAWYYGRRIHPFVLLPFAAAITVIANPSFLWGDLGWYLSFGAFAGVLVLAPLIQSYFWGPDYKPSLLMEIFIGTTAAQIATMPIILISFGVYFSFALAANMLVLPLVPLAMLLTFVSGLAGVILPSIASIVGWPATLVVQYMTTVIDKIAGLPGAQGEITYGVAALIISYLVMIVSCAYFIRSTRHNFRTGTNILLGERA